MGVGVLIITISNKRSPNSSSRTTSRGSSQMIGIGLILVRLFMLFKSARVSSFGFYRFGNISTSGIILVLMILSGIALVVKPCMVTKIFMGLTVAMLVLSLILGTHIGFWGITVLDIILMLVPTVIGTGLLIKSFIPDKKDKK